MDITIQKFYTSKDVIFHETIFPFSTTLQQSMFPIQNSGDYHDYPDLSSLPSPAHPQPAPEIQPIRRSTKLHKPPSYLHDYVCTAITESYCFLTLANLDFVPSSLPIHFLSSSNQTLLETLDYTEPQTYDQAVLHLGWQEAMQKELHALKETNTWDVVSLPKGKKPIACKGVYKIKCKADGSIE